MPKPIRRRRVEAGPRIYFGGKIAKNDWRYDLGAEPETENYEFRPNYPWQEHETSLNVGDKRIPYTYTGPFFQSCDHGCYHGENTHGVGLISETRTYLEDDTETPWAGCGGEVYERANVRDKCLEAIRRSDVMFIWLDSMSAYGTLVEAGYAHALEKCIWVAHDSFNYDDMWFLFGIAQLRAEASHPSVALAHFLTAHYKAA